MISYLISSSCRSCRSILFRRIQIYSVNSWFSSAFSSRFFSFLHGSVTGIELAPSQTLKQLQNVRAMKCHAWQFHTTPDILPIPCLQGMWHCPSSLTLWIVTVRCYWPPILNFPRSPVERGRLQLPPHNHRPSVPHPSSWTAMAAPSRPSRPCRMAGDLNPRTSNGPDRSPKAVVKPPLWWSVTCQVIWHKQSCWMNWTNSACQSSMTSATCREISTLQRTKAPWHRIEVHKLSSFCFQAILIDSWLFTLQWCTRCVDFCWLGDAWCFFFNWNNMNLPWCPRLCLRELCVSRNSSHVGTSDRWPAVMVEAKERTCGIRGCKCAICKLTIIDIQHDIILDLSTGVSLRFLYITVNGDPIAAEWQLSRVQHIST